MKRTSTWLDEYLLVWLRETAERLDPYLKSRSEVLRKALLLGLKHINQRIERNELHKLQAEIQRAEAGAKTRPRPRTTDRYSIAAATEGFSRLYGTSASPPICCN